MTFGDINSGAVPQPGGVVYRRDEDAEKTPQEVTEEATKKAIAGEPPYDNAQAGLDETGNLRVPTVEADDAKATGGSSAGQGDPDSDGDGTDSPIEGGNSRVPNQGGDDGDEDGDEEPAKSALKEEWVKYAVSKGASEDEANDSTKDELVEKYGK